MPDMVVDGEPSNLDTPRHDSSKAAHPTKDSEPPTPSSSFPITRLTRKRAASLNIESTNHPRIEDLALSSAGSSGPPTSDPTREHVCLCQPDPKIPRPRNAFILYRQHYQAQVVAQHPGLANPEISKIIGEQWREQAPEVKNDWKRLAEEEKQRHQRQYPDYRYQPRRSGRSTGVRPVSASITDDPGRCQKCSGRYISTPSTPSTPFTPALGAPQGPRNDRLLPEFIPSTAPSAQNSLSSTQIDRARYLPQMHNVRKDNVPVHQQTHRRTQYTPQPLHVVRERDKELDLASPSPDFKRRRFGNEHQCGYPSSSSPLSYSAPQPFSRNPVPMSTTSYRPTQLSGPGGMLVRPGNMGPPPHSPMVQQPRAHYPPRSSTYDKSLRLPPLQTQQPTSSTPTSSQRPNTSSDSREIQARSVEAMVMSIPYVNKIKVLTKISPPLAQPGPTSPAREIRGALIAVESADKALIEEIGIFINEHLRKDASCTVKTWMATAPSNQLLPRTSDTEMTDAGSHPISPHSKFLARRVSEHADVDPFVDYLSIISEWHKKSAEIVKFITTAPAGNPAEPESSSSSSNLIKSVPVALVPSGFSLTTSDIFALRIPINDSYAPVDHWQWMATLWRGIVGPDLTIYAKRVDKDEMDRCGGVEMREDCAGIIVRVTDSGNMDEKTARRLGFEVMEFVRSMESGFGKP